MKSENSTLEKVVLFIIALLSLSGMVMAVVSSFGKDGFSSLHIISNVATVIMYFALLIYVIRDYIKPHGNMLRYCFIIFAFGLSAMIISQIKTGYFNIACITLNLIAVIISSYVGGRLNKFEKNQYIVMIGALLLALNIFSRNADIFGSFQMNFLSGNVTDNLDSAKDSLNSFVLWVCMSSAYVLRFKQHSKAGFDEKTAQNNNE